MFSELQFFAIGSFPSMDYLEFAQNYTSVDLDAFPEDVAEALEQEVDALTRVLGYIKAGLAQECAADLEAAERKFNRLRSLHVLDGIDIVVLRTLQEEADSASEYEESICSYSEDEEEDLPTPLSTSASSPRMTCSESQLQAAIASEPSFDYMEAAEEYAKVYGDEFKEFVRQALVRAGRL
ncbi:hypothetical protein PUNSTDRAFT_136942 [Punctularia strigosozonata HHB-11173 SS5]|uniref:uncharacterized protein n=1 Tax=Punctularia strigosozonata (strain HHB-11173) TaxID=741275 RepID=UPI0004416ED9|nr:uncharacterized protein PUNSTDRAFT_136942 [Punctularia strigosozonata HHB-11173 SS5]EIN06150.1 hypothetical protein PUNSTDRAFT_136942 [Punctularia strigosozonata HHB-11173 SS5]